VLRSSVRELVAWARMGPMIVRIPITNGPPIVIEPEGELFPMQRTVTIGRDQFFKNVCRTVSTKSVLISHIIIARVILFTISNREVGAPVRAGKPINDREISLVWVGQGLRFTRFFETTAKCREAINTVWRTLSKEPPTPLSARLRRAATVNSESWVTHSVRGLDVLQAPHHSHETQMDDLLNLEDKFFALKRAERGYITRNFLIWLLSKKDWYNHYRGEGITPTEREVEVQCSILTIRRATEY
jgi:hypothetical protein